jgi:hypothetical protein
MAARLREAGCDADAVAERDDLVGRIDSTILEVATSDWRAVVTNNSQDFRPLAAERLARGRTHGGLIVVPSARTPHRRGYPLAGGRNRDSDARQSRRIDRR